MNTVAARALWYVCVHAVLQKICFLQYVGRGTANRWDARAGSERMAWSLAVTVYSLAAWQDQPVLGRESWDVCWGTTPGQQPLFYHSLGITNVAHTALAHWITSTARTTPPYPQCSPTAPTATIIHCFREQRLSHVSVSVQDAHRPLNAVR